MRSSRVLPLVAGVLLIAACGGDSNGPANTAPTAGFTSECTDLACSFTDLSTDSDGSVASYQWSFGGDGTSTQRNPIHTFSAGGTFDVQLTVTDNDGDTGNLTKQVTVTAPAVGGPTANFAVACASFDCTVTDQSTAAVGATITGWAWDFGDGATSTAQNPPTHHFDASTLSYYTVKLVVTDNNGLKSTRQRQISVSPPAELTCDGVACTLDITVDSKVTVTLTDRDCTAQGNTFRMTAPIEETLFTNGCSVPKGTSYDLNGGGVFVAGTHLSAEVISGSIKQVTAPALHVTGSFPTWTLAFDDGEGGTGEPDFNDLIITITATPQ